MDVEISWATMADIDAVIALLKAVAGYRESKGQYRWDKASFTQGAIASWIERHELVVARRGGVIVGAMLVQPIDHVFWPDRPDGEALHVHKLARDPAVPQAKGLARHLIAFAEDAAREAGRPYLRLDCAPEPRLCALYQGLGFTHIDQVAITADFISERWEKSV
jgi:ribosomal protein S18 acetylase RimI-like enzyme